MPRLDGTGPMGMGQMTGRGFGPCSRSYGYGRRFVSPKNELSALEQEEKELEQELAVIREEKVALQKKQQ